MHRLRNTLLGAVAGIAVCMGVAAVHVWQAHGSGIASARSHIASLPIAD